MAVVNNTLAEALVAFHKDAPQIPRSKTVEVKGKAADGREFKYTFSYAPLDAIFELSRAKLAAQGLVLSQLLASTEAGHPALKTVLMHASGESLESVFPLPIKGGETAQQIGSLISYVRRYAVVSILGLATEEDDDGNHASGNQATARTGSGAGEPQKDSAVPAPPGAGDPTITEPQAKKMLAVGTKLLKAGVIGEEQMAVLTKAANDPTTKRKAASDVLAKLEKLEKEHEEQAVLPT